MTTNCIRIEVESIHLRGDKPEGPIVACVAGARYEFLAPASWWHWEGDRAVYEGSDAPVTSLAVYCHQDMNGVQSWYAFPSSDARALHQRLMEVDKVGAKSALTMMARNSCDEFYSLLDVGDREGFAKLKGMGGKTGAAVVEHLFKDVVVKSSPKSIKLDEDAVAALVALGYKAVNAKDLVGKAMQALPGGTSEAIIALALKR
jgi:Holliday junction resolvasome RuvABC DNA-binding subunit